jgi:hypothetical protein
MGKGGRREKLGTVGDTKTKQTHKPNENLYLSGITNKNKQRKKLKVGRRNPANYFFGSPVCEYPLDLELDLFWQ